MTGLSMPRPSPEVLVAWRPSSPERLAAWEWARGRYRWPVRLCEAPGGPWCKARAINPSLAARDPAQVVVVTDADVWSEGVEDAVAAVEDGAAWAIPHRDVHRLTRDATAAVLAGADWRGAPLEQAPYRGVRGGGYVVARAETLLRAPLDARFAGWGQEDVSWGLALHTLFGQPWRGDADLVHLWHPPQARMTRKYGSEAGRSLWRRYARAFGNPDEMQALIGEARDAYPTPEPSRLGASAL